MVPTSPPDLCNIEPTFSSIVVLRDDHKRVVDLATWNELPKLQWTEILALVGAKAPAGAK